MNTVACIGQPSSDVPPPCRLSLPYKVMKSLDRDVYRNLEFDVWQDTCKGKWADSLTQCELVVKSSGSLQTACVLC